MPKARSIEEIVADPDIATELAAGAILVSVPFAGSAFWSSKGTSSVSR
jgi:hypothetical protein